MVDDSDRSRRHFLGAAAMTIAAAQFGLSTDAAAQGRPPRVWTTVGRATTWLNSPRLDAADLQGKVVLVNVCTYTCINWLRTLPYVRAWAQRYQRRLLVLGVHTPEFPFEHDLENVRRALGQMKIDHPIVLDNDYAIWRALDNNYWPALYLIDSRGRIRYRHFGEGEYDESERMIQRVLAEGGNAGDQAGLVSVNASGIEVQANWRDLRSPENYLGHERTQNFASSGGVDPDRRRRYAAPRRMALNDWALAGEWTVGRQVAVSATPDARIVQRFHARDLHLVMGPSRRENPVRFRISVDGNPPGPARGEDVDQAGNGVLVDQRLYQLVRQPGPIVDRQFEIEFLDAGAEAFAFTFG